MPPIRNVNSRFLKVVFRGDKKLLKKSEVKHVGQYFSFKNLSTKAIVDHFPEKNLALKYIPDTQDISKIDRKNVVTVCLLGAELNPPGLHNRAFQKRTDH